MPKFCLSKSARELLASCIEIGLEGCEETAEDQEAVAQILEELQESEAIETVVHIAPPRVYLREIDENRE